MISKQIHFLFLLSVFLIGCIRQSSSQLNEDELIRTYEEFEYPSIRLNGSVLGEFIPSLWVAEDTIYEDLNQDGKTDALLLLTYSDTVDTYEYPKGVINYQFFEQRILLVLLKNKNGYTRNAYCYKLLNFRGGMGRGSLGIEAKPGMLFISFQTTGNGMYELHHTFEYNIKTRHWILIKTEENGGNAEYDMKSMYDFKSDSIHFHSSHWNNNEEDTTWTDYTTDIDTIMHLETRYYLDSMEYWDGTASYLLPSTPSQEDQ